MPRPDISSYALIGDCRSAALVALDGSIDWLCLPDFDSDACFAALLGEREHGCFRIAPVADCHTSRGYHHGTMVLETRFVSPQGEVALIDFMALHTETPTVVRIVVGVRGTVEMRAELAIRFGYGKTVPWVRRCDGEIEAIAGPDLVRVKTPIAMHGESLHHVGDFTVREGDRIPFTLAWSPSNLPPPPALDPEEALQECQRRWHRWSRRCVGNGPYQDILMRSLLTLKALTYAPTGGIVAAPTTSLPEKIGGVRNWDYRYCWLRDATFTLFALLNAGYTEEAARWRDWLLRAAAGAPSQLQVLYGLTGTRRHVEIELDWLPGYEGSRPVRIGNAASEQLQLDIYGEILDTMYFAHEAGLETTREAWAVLRALVTHLETAWQRPDNGIWEVRGPQRHFTHSKVMCWVAFDRGVKMIERFGMKGPLERWRAAREAVFTAVCSEGFDHERGAFVQSFGARDLDASLLLIGQVGFLPPDDPRFVATVNAIERELMPEGLVLRYETEPAVEGLPPGEGVFLACSFWLVDALFLVGREADARRMFDRLAGLANDVGLLAEEYDPATKRMLGNFPQALSHLALVGSALNLSRAAGPADQRRKSS